jgi:predicted nucleotidyltransferase
MKNVGIICEYNPLHGGHKYMISRLREMGAEKIICLMSGNSVQRGDFAIMPKHLRACSAVSAGADAAFELPFPYSMGSAELFASAGVDILARLGVDTIAFGSESGDLDVLRALARKAEDYKPSNDKSIGTAADYFAALGDLKSNDILGIEYLKAGKMFAPNMNFVTVKREGAGYHDDAEKGAYPSATEIRRAMLEENIEAYSEAQLPEHSKCAIREAFEEGQIALMKKVESAILFFWRTADIQAVSACAECGGGVAERLSAAAKSAATLEEMLELSATKRYTDARLRRAAIFGMMGVTLADLKRRSPYVNLLCANADGLEFLSAVSEINVISKPSRIPEDVDSQRQAQLGMKFDALYTLAMNYASDAGFFCRQSPHIIKNDNKF